MYSSTMRGKRGECDPPVSMSTIRATDGEGGGWGRVRVKVVS